MKKLFLLFLLTLWACTAQTMAPAPVIPSVKTPNIVMHGDVAFSQEERAEIQRAEDMWSYQTSGMAHMAIIWDLDFDKEEVLSKAEEEGWNTVVRLTSDMVIVAKADAEADMTVLAWVSPRGGMHRGVPVSMSFVADRLPSTRINSSFPSPLSLVALHESGHVFGMPHSPAAQAIMYPTYKVQRLCLTVPDLQLFCSVNVCDKPTTPCEGE